MSRSKEEKSTKKGSLAYVQKGINSISKRVSQLMSPYLRFVSLFTAISRKLAMSVECSTSSPFSALILSETSFNKAN